MGVRNSSKFSVQLNNILQLPSDVSELASVHIDLGHLKEDFHSPAPKTVSNRRESRAYFSTRDDWKLT